MHKFFASLAVVSLLFAICLVAANQSSPSLKSVEDQNVEGGGGCYVFTQSLCPGGSSTCAQTLCTSTNGGGSWTCNVTEVQRRQRQEFGGTYNSGYSDVDNQEGWNGYSSSQVICTLVYHCTQSCVLDVSTQQYRCDGIDYATAIERTHYEGTDGYCQ